MQVTQKMIHAMFVVAGVAALAATAPAWGATFASGGGCSIYFRQGTLANARRGRLVVVYDVTFITNDSAPISVNTVPFRHNLEVLVDSGAPPLPQPLAPVPGLSAWAQVALATMVAALDAAVLGRRRRAWPRVGKRAPDRNGSLRQ